MKNTVLDFLLDLQSVRNGDECWQNVQSRFGSLGFETVTFGAVDHDTATPLAIMSNLDPDWMAHYGENSLQDHDPFFTRAVTGNEPAFYSFEDRDRLFPSRSSKGEKVLTETFDIGMNCSFFVNFRSEVTSGFNLASAANASDMERYVAENEADIVMTAAIATLCLWSFHSQERPGEWVAFERDGIELSGREIEALKWLAAGLRNDRIAEKMNITLPTVNFHISSARKKLGAATREQAIALAVAGGHIEI